MLVPKLRFKREDGTDYPEWEDWVLDSIGSFYGGLSGKTKEDFGKGNSKFVTYMNVYKNIFAMQEMLESVDISDNEKQNKVKYGDLLMTQSSETFEELGMSSVYLFYDEPYLNSFCFGLHLYNHALTYPMYIGYLMRSEAIRKQIMREGQGISRINLSPNRMKGMILSLPCLEEQQKIADFLSNVDEVIAQSEAEVANLQQQKKAAMQKIFSQEVRFKREDGTSYPEWTKQKLSAVSSRVTRKNKGNITDIPLTIASLYGLVDQREYFKKKIASQNMEGYYLLHNGEFAYNKSHSKGFDFGAIKRLDRYDCGALSTLYICFAVNNKVDSDFMTHYFDSQKWNKEVSIRCAEGARNHGLLNISTNDFFDIDMVLPTDLEEQQKIADFLATYDEAISCAKQELDKWKELKKGLLQQMFA